MCLLAVPLLQCRSSLCLYPENGVLLWFSFSFSFSFRSSLCLHPENRLVDLSYFAGHPYSLLLTNLQSIHRIQWEMSFIYHFHRICIVSQSHWKWKSLASELNVRENLNREQFAYQARRVQRRPFFSE